ncbi:MAG: pentapeptide repeat-containing protein [Nostoc sp. CreGUA01]|nr:pentapeptide repeat-containing protein [Nostoc sp. CreGUA01]
MQHLFQTFKRLIVCLITLSLVITNSIILPDTALADICIGLGNSCSQTGDSGTVLVKPEVKNPNDKNFTNLNLQGKDLIEANLSGANLSQAKLGGANLSGADLSGATLIGANFKGANISGADWNGVKLTKQDLLALLKVNLTGGGWFHSAPIISRQDILDLMESDLHQVILTGDNLSEVNLSGANLSKANLTGANLQGAKLGGVDFKGADLTGAKMPNGKIYKP